MVQTQVLHFGNFYVNQLLKGQLFSKGLLKVIDQWPLVRKLYNTETLILYVFCPWRYEKTNLKSRILLKISEVFSTAQIYVVENKRNKFVFLILATNLCIVSIWTSKNLLRYCKGKACRNDTEIGKMPHALSCPRMWKTRVERRKKRGRKENWNEAVGRYLLPSQLGQTLKEVFIWIRYSKPLS